MKSQGSAEKPWHDADYCLRTIMTNVREDINIIAPDGTVLWHQAGYIGQAPSPAGKCWKLFEGRDERCPHCVHPQIMKDGQPREYETTTGSGSNITHWHVRAVPLRNGDGDIYAILEAAANITEDKHKEVKRREMETRLQQKQKMESLGELAGGIAHDFNNLLMAIMGHAGLALDELSPDAPAAKRIDKIRDASRHAASLCRQMLAYSGKARFVIERIQLDELIRNLCETLRVFISNRVEIKYDLDPDLPDVEGDPSQIEQIVSNLVTNASEAVGDRVGSIFISTYLSNGHSEELPQNCVVGEIANRFYCVIEVADSGCGMDAATKTRIFDPYFSMKGGDHGLGLCTVVGIIRSHHGALLLESEPGKGSTFRVLLPALARHTSKQEKTSTAVPEMPCSTGTVLLIDDDDGVRDVTRGLLEKVGFTVCTAKNGTEGIQCFREHMNGILCVILDLSMPTMGGAQVYEELKKIRDDVPVILSSGYDRDAVAERLITHGHCGFLQKPYEIADLVAEINRVTGQYRLRATTEPTPS